MKILSIDVGMKNLAMCLFNITDDLEYKIELWDVIDLCSEKDFKCCGIKKDKTCCNRKAKYFKNDEYYCKIHAKDKKYKIPSPELHQKRIKSLNFADLKLLANKYDFKYDKCRKSELVNIVCSCISTDFFEHIKKKNTNDLNLVEYGRNLKKAFNKKLKNIQIDGVIVENQIGPLALRMKTLQGMIMQHFIENGITNIAPVNSSNKLKEFLGNKKTTYDERKKESIKITKNLIINTNWNDHFEKHKKKDDLADCFLQAKWYISNKLNN